MRFNLFAPSFVPPPGRLLFAVHRIVLLMAVVRFTRWTVQIFQVIWRFNRLSSLRPCGQISRMSEAIWAVQRVRIARIVRGRLLRIINPVAWRIEVGQWTNEIFGGRRFGVLLFAERASKVRLFKQLRWRRWIIYVLIRMVVWNSLFWNARGEDTRICERKKRKKNSWIYWGSHDLI